jgi:hypothetical protein
VCAGRCGGTYSRCLPKMALACSRRPRSATACVREVRKLAVEEGGRLGESVQHPQKKALAFGITKEEEKARAKYTL